MMSTGFAAMNMELSQWPSPPGFFVFWHCVHMPLASTFQHSCILLLAGLDSELCGTATLLCLAESQTGFRKFGDSLEYEKTNVCDSDFGACENVFLL